MALTPPPLDSHPPPLRDSPRGRPWWRHWQVAFLLVFVPLLLASTESERCSIWSWNPQNELRSGELTVLGEGYVYENTSFTSPPENNPSADPVCQTGQTCWFNDGTTFTVQSDQPAGPPPVGNFIRWEDESSTNLSTDPIFHLNLNDRVVAVFCPYRNLTLTMAGDTSGLIQVVPNPLTAVIHKNNVPHGVATSNATDDSCGKDGCRVQACFGSTVTLTADPLSSFFTGWSGDCQANPSDPFSTTVQMDDHKNCIATFDYPDLTVAVTGNGRVYGTGGINCTTANTPCTIELPLNQEAQLAADPNIGAEFLNWNGDCQVSPTDPLTATVLMDANHSCTAEFQGGVTVGTAGVVELVSVNPGGPSLGDLKYAQLILSPPDSIGGVDLSSDGRTAVFRAVVPGVVTSNVTYFARDVVANTTAALDDDPTTVNSPTSPSQAQISISADGRYAAFDSGDPTLPINDQSGGVRRVFVKDLLTGEVQPVSVDDPFNGIEVRDQAGYQPAISGNGRYVVFSARLVRRPSPPPAPPILETNWTVLVRDTCLGGIPACAPTTHVVSVTDEGARPINPNSQSLVSFVPSISADGRFVAFISNSLLLYTGTSDNLDTNRRVYLHDRDADEDGIFDETPLADCSDTNSCPISTQSISPAHSGADFISGPAETPVISADGRIIAYRLDDSHMVPDYGSAVLRYDTCFGEPPGSCTPGTAGVVGTGTSDDSKNANPDVSGDGRFISMSADLFPLQPILVRDTCLGASPCTPETRLVSLNYLGNPVTAGSGRLSGDGQALVFASNTNLLASSTGILPDIFLAQTGFTPTPGGTPSLSSFVHLPSGNGLPSNYPPLHAGSARRLFAIEGGGFVPGAKVLLDSLPRPTIYISATQLQFRATDDDLSVAHQFQVTVLNPSGAASNDQLLFEILP
jgi:hypothetical protein